MSTLLMLFMAQYGWANFMFHTTLPSRPRQMKIAVSCQYVSVLPFTLSVHGLWPILLTMEATHEGPFGPG